MSDGLTPDQMRQSLDLIGRPLAIETLRQISAQPQTSATMRVLAEYLIIELRSIGDLRKSMEEALIKLSGFDNYDIASEIAPELPPNVVETSTARIEAARKVLKAALN